ncbi:MAG: transposase, partial [Candidatus Binatia bacterium]
RQKNWVVYAKKPFGSPQTVLDYLGRYTHRVALSNDRILALENGQVSFSYRDRRDKDRLKSMTLDAEEFIPACAEHGRQAPLPASRDPARLHACPSFRLSR